MPEPRFQNAGQGTAGQYEFAKAVEADVMDRPRVADRWGDAAPLDIQPVASPYHPSKALPPRRLRDKDERPLQDPEVEPARQGSRLAQARKAIGLATASDAARALGIAPPTYLAHENGTRQIRPDIAEFYAHKYKISTDWLLYARGAMSRDTAAAGPSRVQAAPPAAAARMLESRIAPGGPGVIYAQKPVMATSAAAVPASLPSPSDRMSVPEVSAAAGAPDGETAIVLGDGDDTLNFHVRDHLRLPADMVEDRQLLAFKLPDNTVLPGLSGGQRVFVDVGDRGEQADGYFDDGYFMATTKPQGVPFPALIYTDGSGDLHIHRAKGRPALPFDRSKHIVIGRIVAHLSLLRAELAHAAIAELTRL